MARSIETSQNYDELNPNSKTMKLQRRLKCQPNTHCVNNKGGKESNTFRCKTFPSLKSVKPSDQKYHLIKFYSNNTNLNRAKNSRQSSEDKIRI